MLVSRVASIGLTLLRSLRVSMIWRVKIVACMICCLCVLPAALALGLAQSATGSSELSCGHGLHLAQGDSGWIAVAAGGLPAHACLSCRLSVLVYL